ncbi:sugar transferase [Apibacter adventoris]|uniref:Sugar transferase n=1 Tax=Apibacter adventoris TaxID=1679466 RepID=A0A2S8A915_9FLAO|nr:sugar transferase [Apibacter adventoris]PQL91068.1 sugar transferase [Apibacter adventoris]
MKGIKIFMDYSLAFTLLIILILPLILLFILVSINTGKNGIFIQKRVGENAKIFSIYKFRTMKGTYTSSVTTQKMNITKLGKFLRKYKIDEIPQLINILKGDMSWVGPRPDIVGFADKLKGEDKIILSVKPGITGPAQLKYRNEEEILSQVDDPEFYNKEIIWKDKIEINKKYIKNWSLKKDMIYLFKTVF